MGSQRESSQKLHQPLVVPLLTKCATLLEEFVARHRSCLVATHADPVDGVQIRPTVFGLEIVRVDSRAGHAFRARFENLLTQTKGELHPLTHPADLLEELVGPEQSVAEAQIRGDEFAAGAAEELLRSSVPTRGIVCKSLRQRGGCRGCGDREGVVVVEAHHVSNNGSVPVVVPGVVQLTRAPNQDRFSSGAASFLRRAGGTKECARLDDLAVCEPVGESVEHQQSALVAAVPAKFVRLEVSTVGAGPNHPVMRKLGVKGAGRYCGGRVDTGIFHAKSQGYIARGLAFLNHWRAALGKVFVGGKNFRIGEELRDGRSSNVLVVPRITELCRAWRHAKARLVINPMGVFL